MFLNLFPQTRPSIVCVLVPAGGANILGAKNRAEQLVAQRFMERFLEGFLAPIPGFNLANFIADRKLAALNAK